MEIKDIKELVKRYDDCNITREEFEAELLSLYSAQEAKIAELQGLKKWWEERWRNSVLEEWNRNLKRSDEIWFNKYHDSQQQIADLTAKNEANFKKWQGRWDALRKENEALKKNHDWYCACDHWNGSNLSVCAMCGRTPSESCPIKK